MIITNNPKSEGLIYGKIFKIKTKTFNFKKKNLTEKKILFDLKKDKINLVCLAGFMKILSKNFIKNFNGKILNIHPSLLPKFKGLNTHERAISNKEKYSGCTVHFVDSGMDTGPIIAQEEVAVLLTDNEDSLADKVKSKEHVLYPAVIDLLASGNVESP